MVIPWRRRAEHKLASNGVDSGRFFLWRARAVRRPLRLGL